MRYGNFACSLMHADAACSSACREKALSRFTNMAKSIWIMGILTWQAAGSTGGEYPASGCPDVADKTDKTMPTR
jgi:hypothetical protein